MSKYLILLILLTGCHERITTPVTVDAKDDFEVVFLFRKDKCSLFRFRDSGYYHYFSDCGEVESTRIESCGKGCTHHISENINQQITKRK